MTQARRSPARLGLWLLLILALLALGAAAAYLYWREVLLVRPDQALVAQLQSAGQSLPPVDLTPAFPGAEGAGSLTPGGRGGQVIEVTNLNDSGPGSLRQAVDTPGPRIVVFRVGGVIELERPIRIREPYLTLAGQTAPGGGITLSGKQNQDGELFILQDVHDVVIRFLRFRNGGDGEPGHGQINIAIDSGTHDIVIDHVSLSWTLDENLMIHRNIPDGEDPAGWPEIYNLTLQWSLIAEGLSPHSTGTQIGGEAEVDGWQGVHDITLHHNLYAHNSHRNPGVGSLRTQVINNVVYNWSPRVGSTWRNIDVDWIGNYFKAGPMSDPDSLLVHVAFPRDRPDQPWPMPSLYVAGNLAPPGRRNPEGDNWDMYRLHYINQPLPQEFRRSQPLSTAGLPVSLQPAAEAYENVLIGAGASARLGCSEGWVYNPDAVDRRLVEEVRRGEGPDKQPPAHENEVGGFAPVEPGEPCPDGDHDGMPDAWEALASLDPRRDDSAGYALHDRYTNLEVYLNGMVLPSQAVEASR